MRRQYTNHYLLYYEQKANLEMSNFPFRLAFFLCFHRSATNDAIQRTICIIARKCIRSVFAFTSFSLSFSFCFCFIHSNKCHAFASFSFKSRFVPFEIVMDDWLKMSRSPLYIHKLETATSVLKVSKRWKFSKFVQS